MGDPVPVRISRARTFGAVLPVDAYSLAVACGSRGVSLDIWPASLSAPAAPRVVLFQDTTGTAPRPARHVAPRPGSRHAGSCPAGAGSLPRLGGLPWPSWYASVRALPRMWRTVPCDASSTAYAAALQRGTGAALVAAFTRRALRPGNVASGDRCVRGTIAPRHHAGTRNLVSKALGATGPKADFAACHYPFRANPHTFADRVVTAACASSPPSPRRRSHARGASPPPRPSRRSALFARGHSLRAIGGRCNGRG